MVRVLLEDLMVGVAFRRNPVVVYLSALGVALLSGLSGGCDCRPFSRGQPGGCNFDLDFSGCSITSPCGNGVLDEGEECDEGPANSDTEPDRCRTTCRLPHCGDDVVDGDEECELDPGEVEECTALGLTGGTAVCMTNCRYDLSECSLCGDRFVEGSEECDSAPPPDVSCLDLGFEGGEPSCTADCRVDITTCVGCGNTVLDVGERCDGTDLNGATCASLGFDDGILGCTADCRHDMSGCWECGNGVCERTAGEGATSCPEDCGWTLLSTGGFNTCGVRMDGSAWCWGDNGAGALGVGSYSGPQTCSGGPCSTEPVRVLNLAGVVDLAVGAGHACALDATDLHCWGDNSHGQVGQALGNLCTQDYCWPHPLKVPLFDPMAVTAGDAFTCALDTDSAVWCWGRNDRGQLGDGTTTGGATPVPVEGIEPAASGVVAGTHHACALTTTGTVMCWGSNALGALGLGSGPEDCGGVDCSRTALPVLGVTDVVELAAGTGFTCALTSGGVVWCWGWNLHGQLGDGGIVESLIPQEVRGSGLESVVGLDAGAWHVLALDEEGGVWVWGDPPPAGGGAAPLKPERVPALPSTRLVSAGDILSAVVSGDASGWCWGDNDFGALGDGTTSSSATPLRIE